VSFARIIMKIDKTPTFLDMVSESVGYKHRLEGLPSWCLDFSITSTHLGDLLP
jgi:hypothetical protein